MKQHQFKITLGDELRAKLDDSSLRNFRSVAEDIRQRLEMSFDIDGDGHTLDLIYAILFLAHETMRDFGTTWWGDERARSAFMAAIADQVMSYPISPSDLAAKPLITLGTREQQAGPEDPPEAIGRAIARNYRRRVRPLGLRSDEFDIRRFRQLMRNEKKNDD
ncbi:hypothetical protein [Bradyrhizobium arachidis]|uniref:Uncharacterized protein n=1 Tax=Bradyrhizobium arachidis TaxID=858423 RepID=A0AAE7NX00_9BRAD|nr:hypothetical protein [Bradyrhizobium arachidis]QOZ71735.1 hypothetical protein WN72_39670 [Bradyrhizobium arachidis]SFV19135.1 hypothetical protein SAMN05192541_14611 [Bradyrhizobium arachidis]